jgi:hypothetical protein
MKAGIVLCFCAAMGAAADQPAAVKPADIPAGAVQTGPGSYRYTDAGGTAWLLRRTPFGVAAVEEKASELVKATEAGDNIRFERRTPFASYTWTKKKSELSASERAVWERAREAAK